MMVNGLGVSLWSDENVLKLIAMIFAQLCEYSRNTDVFIVHFK